MRTNSQTKERNMANYLDYLIEENKFQNMEQSAIFNGMVDDYQGTCYSLSEGDFEWLDTHGYIEAWDNTLFECDTCGWWYEIAEQGEHEGYESICEDCCEGN